MARICEAGLKLLADQSGYLAACPRSSRERGRPPTRRGPDSGIVRRIVIRCTPAYHAWVVGLADHASATVSRSIQVGLARLADQVGFIEPIPRRVEPNPHYRYALYPSRDLAPLRK